MAAVKDICPELIQDVNRQFQKNCLKDVEMKKRSEKAQNGTATDADAYRYAESVGSARADAFKSQISAEVLPDGRMYYNIAERLMTDSLTADHDMVATFAEEVQKAINENAGIHIKAQRADVDEDRIDGFVQRLASADNYDDVAWITQEPVRVHARSVVDDTIKKNAEFQHKAGIKAEVKRDSSGDCCKWCDGLVGEYTYPGVPREVFARHDNCRCTLDYNGRRLTAYESGGRARSFRDQGEQEKIEARKELANRLDEQLAQNKALKGNGGDAIMKSETASERSRQHKMHTEKYGESAIFVNKKYIDSDDYTNKFIGITGDGSVDNKLAEKAKSILNNRSGSFNETLVLFDKSTGKDFLTISVDDDTQRIKYTEKDIDIIKRARDKGVEILAMHNHPTGWPPTADDCVTAHDKGYGMGITCGHNGTVYTYYPSEVSFTDSECRQIHNIIAEKSEYEKDINRILKTWEETLLEFDMRIKERR